MLELYEGHIEAKKKKALENEKNQQMQIDLAKAGKPSRQAAMGKMSEHLQFEDVNEESAQERARRKRDERKREAAKRKSKTLQDAFEPLCKVMRRTNKDNRRAQRKELKFRRKQCRVETQLSSIMCLMMGKDTITPETKKGLCDLTKIIGDDSDSSTSSDSDGGAE